MNWKELAAVVGILILTILVSHIAGRLFDADPDDIQSGAALVFALWAWHRTEARK